MRIKPTGKISAPTSGWPVCTAPVMARLVAAARIAAGERAADDEIGRRLNLNLRRPVSTMALATSTGFT